MNAARFASVCVIVVAGFADFAAGEVTVDKMFGDHMVLQRDMPVPVWGTARPGQKVTVAFGDQTRQAQADKGGKWMVRLGAMKVGRPGKMTVSGSARPIVFNDVVVGEVWLGSGQSNMAHGARLMSRQDPALAAIITGGPYPNLRVYRGGWLQGSEESVARFSGLLLSFGVPLQKELDVPVGLIARAIWGTASGRWLTAEMMTDDEACRGLLNKAGVDPRDPASQSKWYAGELAQWKKAVQTAKGQAKQPRKPRRQLERGDLYEKHVKPVIPYAIRGVLWDQGESGTAIDALDQYALMGALIGGWRKAWGQGEFPFLYVQKPSGCGCAWDANDPVTCKADKFATQPAKPNGPNDGRRRRMYIRIMGHPNTAMVSASDLGSGVHPVNKAGYGARACRVAMGFVYGKDVEYYGPVYDSHLVEGKAIRVKFTHVSGGLAVPAGQKLQGFEVAGADDAYHWAEAKIDGQCVVVSSDKVPAPVNVRYGWARSRPWANLFNSAHLPALTFRTGNWPRRRRILHKSCGDVSL